MVKRVALNLAKNLTRLPASSDVHIGIPGFIILLLYEIPIHGTGEPLFAFHISWWLITALRSKFQNLQCYHHI